MRAGRYGEGGLRKDGGRNQPISPPLLPQSKGTTHYPKRNAGSHLLINLRRKTMPLPRNAFAKNRLHRNKSRKAKLNEPVRQVLPQLAQKGHSVVAEYVLGVTNRAEKTSRTITARHNWTIRGDVLEGVWHRMGLRPTIDAFADDHNHHPPSIGPTSHRLTRPEQTQWRRSGTDDSCCTSTLHGG